MFKKDKDYSGYDERQELILSLIHIYLAEKIEKEAAKRDMIANVLLEVNVAREESKFGMFLEDVIPNLKEIQAFPHVCVKGMIDVYKRQL